MGEGRPGRGRRRSGLGRTRRQLDCAPRPTLAWPAVREHRSCRHRTRTGLCRRRKELDGRCDRDWRRTPTERSEPSQEVTSAAEAAHAVAALVGLPLKSVRPVICLVRDEWFSEKFGEVTVCSLLNLVAFVRGSSAGPADEQLDTRRIIYALNNPGPPPQTSQRRSQLDAGATSAGRMRRFARASKLVVAMAIVGVMLLRPEWVTAAAERVGEELTSRFVITDTAGQPPPVQQPGSNEKRNNNRHRKHNEQQSSR